MEINFETEFYLESLLRMYLGETSIRYSGKQDWAEGGVDLHFCGDGASVDSAESSGAGMALWSLFHIAADLTGTRPSYPFISHHWP